MVDQNKHEGTKDGVPESDWVSLSLHRMWRWMVISIVLVCLFLSLTKVIGIPRREHYSARRVICQANLGAIARACNIYAEENGGHLPPSLEILSNEGLLLPKQLVCLRSKKPYIYIPGQENSHDPRSVIAYEPLSNHKNQGGGIAYLGGHSKWHNVEAYRRVIADTKAKLEERAVTRPEE